KYTGCEVVVCVCEVVVCVCEAVVVVVAVVVTVPHTAVVTVAVTVVVVGVVVTHVMSLEALEMITRMPSTVVRSIAFTVIEFVPPLDELVCSLITRVRTPGMMTVSLGVPATTIV